MAHFYQQRFDAAFARICPASIPTQSSTSPDAIVRWLWRIWWLLAIVVLSAYAYLVAWVIDLVGKVLMGK